MTFNFIAAGISSLTSSTDFGIFKILSDILNRAEVFFGNAFSRFVFFSVNPQLSSLVESSSVARVPDDEGLKFGIR